MGKRSVWLLAVPLLAIGGAVAGAAEIRDRAGLFGAEAVKKAEIALDRVERETRVPIVVETIDSLGGRSMPDVSKQEAQRSGIKGLFVLISKQDKKIAARDYNNFLGPAGRKAIEEAFTGEFRGGDFDAGLARGVETIGTQVAQVPPPDQATPARRRAAAPPVAARRGGGGGGGLFGVLLTVGIIILVVMIGLRLLGALFGGGRGGMYPGRPGYGAPGYGGGGYGRGGGFMSSLFGGLGGAMAGNWLYDQFGRRHDSGGTYDAGSYGTDAGSAPDTGTWGGGEGTSWGGGDAGGGWGGDAGGGGDWGGGGGGGGGDWGGGGGDGGSW